MSLTNDSAIFLRNIFLKKSEQSHVCVHMYVCCVCIHEKQKLLTILNPKCPSNLDAIICIKTSESVSYQVLSINGHSTLPIY